MKYHPFQTNKEVLDKLSKVFREAMTKKGILPKNPWKAVRVRRWLEKMGGRMKPGSFHRQPVLERPDTLNFVNFEVPCERSNTRIMGYRNDHRFMRVEIPHELAEKIMLLGFLPDFIRTQG
jgi:hypothetical protein